MSENTVETTVVPTEETAVVEESKKKLNFTRKHLAYAAAGLTAAAATVAVVLKVRNGDYEDLSVPELTDVTDAVTDAITG